MNKILSAQEAAKVTDKNWADGVANSNEWLEKQLKELSDKVFRAASRGERTCEFKLNLSSDNYAAVRKDLILSNLKELGYTVEISVRQMNNKTIEEYTVLTLGW